MTDKDIGVLFGVGLVVLLVGGLKGVFFYALGFGVAYGVDTIRKKFGK